MTESEKEVQEVRRNDRKREGMTGSEKERQDARINDRK